MNIPTSRRWRILAIDDNPSIHEDYKKVLIPRKSHDGLRETEALLFGEDSAAAPKERFTYTIDSAFQGQNGLQMVAEASESGRPYSVALIDVRMPPGWDGVETAQRIWEIAPDLPIVLCTAYSDYGWEEISDRLPRSDQLLILKKPFEPFELRQIVASQVSRWHLNRQSNRSQLLSEAIIERRTRQIESTQDLVFTSLARLAESRDPETGEHLERIEFYTRILAERLFESGPYTDVLSPTYIDYVSRSSILHDIGKVGIPDNVLLKPGRLTAEEFEIMKTHAAIGADALDDAANRSEYCDFLSTAAEIARYHHEKFDGSGYPEQLKGQNIPLSARIVAVADVFDALTSERVYKRAMCPFKAKEIIESERGNHFDPAIVDAFLYCWDRFLEMALENQSKNKPAVETVSS
ncbi:HD domain-containing phosphohydrolase [Mariniblastus fucicola]|nr:HD domain-containing phosphohydrolase [Mariniblastus fucicola]